ncbi:hypothetical protein [Fictibacillus sp. S7]|uniref:hypothetical protein n=1 Tax=Fictibacillus sp. S7 TaxID=2212476 RepID=UPI00101386DB|nr:hypothetical protein [Fictibacillus sp. S7]RXY98633.1 hypothetical protein DMO16_02525 [Fictibacillus sp. S7]
MEEHLLRKWLEKALLTYFNDKKTIPYTEKEYALLLEHIQKEWQTAEDRTLTSPCRMSYMIL